MLINAYNRADEARRNELVKWITATDFNPEEKIKAVTSIYNELGIDRLAEDRIKYYFEQSHKYLDLVSVDDERKSVLRAYTDAMMGRKA